MAFWQLALVASALILLGLNVGAVFNSNLPGGAEQSEEVRLTFLFLFVFTFCRFLFFLDYSFL